MNSKGRRLNGDFFDPMYGYVCAENTQPLPDNLKSMIDTVKEAFPSCGKDKIAMVLQSCDFSLEKTLSSLTKDGGDDLLGNWSTQGKRGKSGNVPNRNKKKRRNRKSAGGNKEQTTETQTKQENNNKESMENVHSEGIQEFARPGSVERSERSSQASDKDDGILPNSDSGVVIGSECSSRKSSFSVPTTPESSSQFRPPLVSSESVSSVSHPSQTIEKNCTAADAAKDNTIKNKEVEQKKKGSPKEIMKRSVKDLQRSAVSIARFHVVLEDECQDAGKKIKAGFQELKKSLQEREQRLLDDLQALKVSAAEKLNQRQADAATLSLRCERIGGMNDLQLVELRADIKHFIGDRKIDEEIAKTSRFIGDHEELLKLINEFGEVPPLKAAYKMRSSVTSSVSTLDDRAFSRASSTVNDEVFAQNLPSQSLPEAKPINVSTAFSLPKNDSTPLTDAGISRPYPLNSSELRERADIHNKLKEALQHNEVSSSFEPLPNGTANTRPAKYRNSGNHEGSRGGRSRRRGGGDAFRNRQGGNYHDSAHDRRPKFTDSSARSTQFGQLPNESGAWRGQMHSRWDNHRTEDSRGNHYRDENKSGDSNRERNWKENSSGGKNKPGSFRNNHAENRGPRPTPGVKKEIHGKEKTSKENVDINSNNVSHINDDRGNQVKGDRGLPQRKPKRGSRRQEYYNDHEHSKVDSKMSSTDKELSGHTFTLKKAAHPVAENGILPRGENTV